MREMLRVPLLTLAALVSTAALAQETAPTPEAAPAPEAATAPEPATPQADAPAADAAAADAAATDAGAAAEAAPAAEAAAPTAGEGEAAAEPVKWQEWRARNDVRNLASLQRGARNYMAYCSGCHSIKYKRYSRLGEDLRIPEDQLEKYIVLPGSKSTDYILTSLSPEDGEAWFGKKPPDLSLITRSKGADYVFQFMMTFYADPSAATGVNNLALKNTAMPHVLSDLQGVQTAVFRQEERVGANGATTTEKVFARFEQPEGGSLSAEEYEVFVRDIVNFLDYVGDPSQTKRETLGVWVILFLLVFTTLAYFMKREYWKDVK